MQKKTAAVSMLITLVMAFAGAQTLGKVDYIEGSVELTRDGVPVRGIDIGTPIENMDVVKTGGDGSVSISFSPESGLTGTLQIVPGTSALIRSDQISGTTTNEVKLMAGSVNLKDKRIAASLHHEWKNLVVGRYVEDFFCIVPFHVSVPLLFSIYHSNPIFERSTAPPAGTAVSVRIILGPIVIGL